jgi:ABC-type lipoprotein export system ATPase subunit
MPLIRVYNLESIMTESDHAATRKSILGHFSLETNAGAIACVVVPAGSGGRRGGTARGLERIPAAGLD